MKSEETPVEPASEAYVVLLLSFASPIDTYISVPAEAAAAEPSSTSETPAPKEDKAEQSEKEEEKKVNRQSTSLLRQLIYYRKESTPKAIKVGRRLSSRVGNFFKPKRQEDVTTPAKVDENPPKIDEPEPVAPLENPVENKTEEVAAPAEEVRFVSCYFFSLV